MKSLRESFCTVSSISRARLRRCAAALAIAVALAMALLAAPLVEAQIETVLYSFPTVTAGQSPQGALLRDASGNLYGTTDSGGSANDYGVVFELANSAGTYTGKVLHSFGPSGGYEPNGGLIMDAAGNLYGTTQADTQASNDYSGIVYELVNSSGTYTDKVLYQFGSIPGDGQVPPAGVIMDNSGNLYGTTRYGGASGFGTVFELVNSSGTYSEKILYSFPSGSSAPSGGLIMDASGNLYGNASPVNGSTGYGFVFELVNSAGTFSEKTLYAFTNVDGDGTSPYGSLAMDASGNLYGTTYGGGSASEGTVFELVNASGVYSEKILHNFGSSYDDGQQPNPGLVMDPSGNLYGTTSLGGPEDVGTAFELVYPTYSETVLHGFAPADGDGWGPYGSPIIDPSGNLYGSTLDGPGNLAEGTVYEISPRFCATPNPNLNPNPESFASPGDFNGDCKSDILWDNSSTGQVYQWIMNGTSTLSAGTPGGAPSPWTIAGEADFNGDGRADILWRNSTTGEVYLWLMSGTASPSQTSLGSVSTAWSIAGVGDFNDDGKADILWRNSSTGWVYIWLMNGETITSATSVGYASSNWIIKGIGDFNDDGNADILWQNSTTGEVYVWLMNGTALASSGTPGAAPPPWTIEGIGDFNGDGKSDILWQNTSTGQVYIWFMNGTALASAASPGTVASPWTITGVGDYNGDGKADMLWQNTSTGQVYVWLMNGATLTSSGSPGSAGPPWEIVP